ncbi:MAG: outer membrane assembly lipoprotein YfgL [Gallionellaceae bacterium]|nr:MAG: outer membrane assembly lipoprotein YfgL [Gallionellaceae bacterium]
MRFVRLLALAITASLVACSSDKATVEPAKLVTFKPSAKVDVRWKQRVGEAGFSVLTPAVTREGVFAADSKYVYRFDRDNGKKVWRIEPGFTISGGVGAGDGLVLVGGDKGEVAAYEDETGKLRWKTKASSAHRLWPKV